jgi:hypothetical protein
MSVADIRDAIAAGQVTKLRSVLVRAGQLILMTCSNVVL